MKIVRYQHEDKIHYGILDEQECVRALAGSPYESLDTTDESLPLSTVRLLAPVESPRLIGVGLNYAAHAAESGKEHPAQPMVFMLPSTAVIGPGDAIVYPLQGDNVHFEGELAVVIGRRARRVSETEALDYVLGYTCGNDVSERVIQAAEMDLGCLLVGKGFDTFKPLGPWIETNVDPTGLRLRTHLNGETRQDANTSDLIFSVPRLVAYLSEAITLLPGDVIMTGTPSGVGPLAPGDVVEIEIEGIGSLRNNVVSEVS